MSADHIPASDPDDILFERLNYLLDQHAGEHADCAECARAATIKRLLLDPFSDTR